MTEPVSCLCRKLCLTVFIFIFYSTKNSLENIGQLDMLTLMFKNISMTVKQQRYIYREIQPLFCNNLKRSIIYKNTGSLCYIPETNGFSKSTIFQLKYINIHQCNHCLESMGIWWQLKHMSRSNESNKMLLYYKIISKANLF